MGRQTHLSLLKTHFHDETSVGFGASCGLLISFHELDGNISRRKYSMYAPYLDHHVMAWSS